MPGTADARPRGYGYCEQGGHQVITGGMLSTKPFQISSPQCTVTVYITGTSTPATIYSNNSGTAQSNPFTADVTGYWDFYADNGTYDVQFSGLGVPVPYTWGGISLFDPLGDVTFTNLTITGTLDIEGTCIGCAPLEPIISATQPLFLYSHFRDDDPAHLRLSYSRDAVNYADVNKQGSYAASSFRDPSVLYLQSTHTYYFLATPNTGCQIQFVSSTDLINFATVGTINMATYDSSCQTAWAPEWWQDPNSGIIYFWVSVGHVSNPTYNSPKVPWLVQFAPSTGVVATANAVTLNGTTQGNTFDYYPYYAAGTYYIFYVDQQNTPTVTQPIAYATASSLNGPYTQQTTPGADYFGFGNSFQTEAPTLIPSVQVSGRSGCVRIMVDVWRYQVGNVPPENIGRIYSQLYRDSCTSAGALFSSGSIVDGPNAINIGKSEHGTVIPITTNIPAAIIYSAAAYTNADANITGNFCVNTAQCNYAASVKALPSFAEGITEQQTATLALGYGSYNSGFDATLSACLQMSQGCWPPPPTPGRLFTYQSNDGSWGSFQIINANTNTTSEASFMLCDGCNQPGSPPTSTNGLKSIWTIGVNNQANDLGANNQWFTIFNAGIPNGGTSGGFPLGISPDTGFVRFPVAIQFGLGLNSLYGHDVFASIDAFGSGGSNPSRINLGNGTPGDATALVFLGQATYNPTTYAALIAKGACGAGVTGRVGFISDGNTNTWGAVVAGGGAIPVWVGCNGTNWTVIGK